MRNQSKLSWDYRRVPITTCPQRYITLTGASGNVDRPNGTLAVKHSTLGNRVYVRFEQNVGQRDFAVTLASFAFCRPYFAYRRVFTRWSV
jgi:hypothetical protein